MKYQGNVYGAYESFWIVIDDTVWFVRAGGELFGPYKSKRAAQKAHNIKDVEKIKSGVYKCRDSSAHVQRRDRTRIPSSFDYNWPGLNDNS